MEKEKIKLYLLHEHSLDNNDFCDKETYEFEVNNLKKHHLNQIISQPHGKWIGLTGHFIYETKELLQYEP